MGDYNIPKTNNGWTTQTIAQKIQKSMRKNLKLSGMSKKKWLSPLVELGAPQRAVLEGNIIETEQYSN